MDRRHLDHRASIIVMDNILFDQVIFIFIDPGSKYNYVSPKLVDKCVLSKESHGE